jgi:acylphosphatase
MKRARVVVAGRVQAVGFRWACKDEARRRGLGGWVRNLPDGSVEAAFEGPDEEVAAMVAWCRTGPSWADVTAIEVAEEPPVGERRFVISE